MARILIPLPDTDFDTTEVAVPWRLLSVLHWHRTTCLPKYMEALAYGLTAWKLGRYYRTSPAYVEDEVRAVPAAPEQFQRGPVTLGKRGTQADDGAAFVVEDGNYLSARWPGDAYLLAARLIALLAPAAGRRAAT